MFFPKHTLFFIVYFFKILYVSFMSFLKTSSFYLKCHYSSGFTMAPILNSLPSFCHCLYSAVAAKSTSPDELIAVSSESYSRCPRHQKSQHRTDHYSNQYLYFCLFTYILFIILLSQKKYPHEQKHREYHSRKDSAFQVIRCQT